MKKLFFIANIFFFFISIIMAQTNVDKLTNALDSLTAYNFNNWRISPNLSNPIEGNPASPEFDDSNWKI